MSDDFIPLNQSTPVGGKWQGRNNQRGHQHHNNRFQNSPRRGGYNKWGNNSRQNSSYGSDSNNSYGQERYSIDAYLHPSMLQDPWEPLRRKLNNSNA